MKNRIKRSKLPEVRLKLLEKQNHKCALCGIDLREKEPKDLCVDHCHKNGKIRAVLCRNCNGIEGKIFNLVNRAKRERTPLEFLRTLAEYWDMHDANSINDTTLFHPDHKSADEKRIAKNKKARLSYAKKRALKNVGAK